MIAEAERSRSREDLLRQLDELEAAIDPDYHDIREQTRALQSQAASAPDSSLAIAASLQDTIELARRGMEAAQAQARDVAAAEACKIELEKATIAWTEQQRELQAALSEIGALLQEDDISSRLEDILQKLSALDAHLLRQGLRNLRTEAEHLGSLPGSIDDLSIRAFESELEESELRRVRLLDSVTDRLALKQADQAKEIANSVPVHTAAETAEQEKTTFAEPIGPASALDPKARSRRTSEDVFGPEIYTIDVLSSSQSAGPSSPASLPGAPVCAPEQAANTSFAIQESALDDLKACIQDINTYAWIANVTSPHRPLPSLREAEAIQRQVSLAHAQLDDLSVDGGACDNVASIEAVQLLLAQKSEDAATVAALADFGSSASECDNAISHLLDALDEQENEISPSTLNETDMLVRRAQGKAAGLQDVRVADRLAQIEQVWADLKELIERGGSDGGSMSQPRSRSGSVASNVSASSSRILGKGHFSIKGPAARMLSLAIPRTSSVTSLSRLPIASTPRNRKTSTASTASTSSASRLPVRAASAAPTGKFLAPRAISHKKSRKFGDGLGRASPLSRQSSLSKLDNLTPPGSRRSSNRRSSGARDADVNDRPNNYRANSKRKLDVAVGNIVNTMNVSFTS